MSGNVSRLERMRLARSIPQVTLQRYNQIRSKNTDKLICAFEGDDDVSFYEAMFFRVLDQPISYAPMVCDGKDRVLGLRLILSRNVSTEAKHIRYFVDKDFDGLKGHASGNDLYCTTTYSIENHLVEVSMIEPLMRAEYRCNDEHGHQDIANIKKLYEDRLKEFMSLMKEPNELIYFARNEKIAASSIDNDLKKYIHISLEAISRSNVKTPVWQLVGLTQQVPPTELERHQAAFSQLHPMHEWRGKFIYAFFRKLLADLKEDRGSKSPQYFTKRANMTFTPQGDIIRTLASMVTIPPCLVQFIEREINPALI